MASMNVIDVLIDLARRPQAAAEELRSALTPQLINAHPHHDNSFAWLLWHSGREIDEQLAQISGNETVWVAQGFAERFALGVEPHEVGYGHTSEEARAIVVEDPALLFEHLNAVIDAQVAYLTLLSPEDASRIVDEKWDPPVTLAARMVSMSLDAAEHVAQAAYIAGIKPGGFE